MALRFLVLVLVLVLLAGCDEGTSPIPTTGFTEVVTGAMHSCALTQDRTAYCWGRGHNGELGIGQLTPGVSVPVRVDTDLRFTSLTAGYYHTCGLALDGRAYCWGWNNWGQSGVADPQSIFLAAPQPVAGDHEMVDLAAGWYHTCGVTAEGDALCWGLNSDGQLGDGTDQDRRSPAAVQMPAPAAAITAGGFHTCATAASGAAYCWGRGGEGQLGYGGSESRSEPVAVAGGHTFAMVDAGRGHTCGVRQDQAILCWGSNGNAELGIEAVGEDGLPGRTRPTRVAREEPFTDVSAGRDYTCAVDAANTGYCWGATGHGQLGIPASGPVRFPLVVPSQAFRQIAAGHRTHTCGVTPSRYLYCWGTGDMGQLGDPGTTNAPAPVPVANPETQ